MWKPTYNMSVAAAQRGLYEIQVNNIMSIMYTYVKEYCKYYYNYTFSFEMPRVCVLCVCVRMCVSGRLNTAQSHPTHRSQYSCIPEQYRRMLKRLV